MNTDDPRILVLYSTPSNLPPLRLGNEHRAVEQVLRDLHVDSSLVYRLHATTTEDLINALLEREYEIVQFSGHGNREGFLLEDTTLRDKGVFVSAKEIANILHETSPKLKVAIFMSCYSTDSISVLVNAAPYIITVTGPADDNAAIEFIARFYSTYLQKGVIKTAFNVARNYVKLINQDSGLISILSRRAEVAKTENQVLYQAFPSGKDDSVLIDLTEAENDIKLLDETEDEFLEELTSKIRVHKWIFDHPRQKVVLPLGKYFGLFSWKDANDVVVCHRILSLKADIKAKELTCEVWASLLVLYNDHFMAPHRALQNVPAPYLERALKEYRKTFEEYFDTGDKARVLRDIDETLFITTRSTIISYLDLAQKKFQQEDHANAIANLEVVLTTIHGFLNKITKLLTV